MKLDAYYRSQASFRVRIALNLKGVTREDSFLHLEKGDQFADAYRAINPQMVVPTAPSTCGVGSAEFGDRQLIETDYQLTLQISAQISNFWVLDALCSAAVI